MFSSLQIKKKLQTINDLTKDISKIISTENNNIVKNKLKKINNELILRPEKNRYTFLPIKHPVLFAMYKILIASHWVPEEVSLEKDIEDWKSLDKNTKYFISNILAFFAISDEIVALNIMENFANEVGILEAKKCYNYICHNEDIHSECYSLMIEAYISNLEEKLKLFKAVEHIPCIAKKVNWAKKWIYSNDSFAKRILAFIIVESIFFSGSFCAIFWLTRNGKMKGLKKMNEFICRDEALHCRFGILIYYLIKNKLDEKTVHSMIKEAVLIEDEFITVSLPCDLIGMNKKLMIQYIKYNADRLLLQLQYNKLYNVKNPFSFMQKIGLENKTNFFEDRVSEYSKLSTNKYNNIINSFFENFISADKYWENIKKKNNIYTHFNKKKVNNNENVDLSIDDDF